MLNRLSIKNYALIERLEMHPVKGLITITGETGAGKSIMVGAIGLLLGDRADKKTLLDENTKCIIEGYFNISNYNLEPFFVHHDLDYEKETILRREIVPSGKSRSFINDTPVTLDVIRSLGLKLLDIHSQHDSLQLSSAGYQIDVIDNYGQHKQILEHYKKAYHAYQVAQKNYDDLKNGIEKFQSEADYNQFLFEELSQLDLQSDEQETLEDEQKLLENAEEIQSKLNLTIQMAEEQDHGFESQIHEVTKILTQLADFSKNLGSLSSRMESCRLEISDIIAEINYEAEKITYDPERANEVNDRLSQIYRLQQKHNVNDIASLIQIQQDLKSKLDKIENFEEELFASEKKLKSAEHDMIDLGNQLTIKRQEAIKPLTDGIQKILADLGMPYARLEVSVNKKSPSPDGCDAIAMLFSANKGITPQEIKKVASGGEFSRLMFSIKYLLTEKIAMPGIIFDEIDAGVSGEIAIKMGNMMKHMAKNHQVMVITHLPQIAAMGHQHFFVFKDHDRMDKTLSLVKELNKDERYFEIAKMIGGDNPSELAQANARELLGST